MRVLEIDGKFIDLDSITVVGPLIPEGVRPVWWFPVFCKLHDRPFIFGDELDCKSPRSEEEIRKIRERLVARWINHG